MSAGLGDRAVAHGRPFGAAARVVQRQATTLAANIGIGRYPAVLAALTGGALMLLGIGAGVALPDGLAASAVLPLVGALLTLPIVGRRALIAVFAAAFASAMAGETAAYLVGGFAKVAALASPASSLVESAIMLAVAYALVGWVSDRWRSAREAATKALASQRRLLEMNAHLLATLDPQAVLNLIADSLKAVVVYDNLTIYRVDREAGLFRAALARDRFAQLILDATFPLGRGITGWVVAHGEAQCVNDAHLDPRTSVIPGTPQESESLIVVPLFVQGQVVGTLNVGRMGGEEAHFSPAEFELATLFAGQASIALQNAELHRAVADRAETDALTGLRNRGAFEPQLEAFLADPAVQPVTLIMLDLDGFKDYNDLNGHPAGDELLRAVGRAIGAAVRSGDCSFRYGGDEFAILLPRTDVEDAAKVAERVRAGIAQPLTGGQRRVTASAGIACHPWHAQDKDALVAAADVSLYGAKQAGGDRLVTYQRTAIRSERCGTTEAWAESTAPR